MIIQPLVRLTLSSSGSFWNNGHLFSLSSCTLGSTLSRLLCCMEDISWFCLIKLLGNITYNPLETWIPCREYINFSIITKKTRINWFSMTFHDRSNMTQRTIDNISELFHVRLEFFTVLKLGAVEVCSVEVLLIAIFHIWCSTMPDLPWCFCPWTFFENIGFNTVLTDPFMSHLATQLGYSAGEFKALQLIVLAAFGVVD